MLLKYPLYINKIIDRKKLKTAWANFKNYHEKKFNIELFQLFLFLYFKISTDTRNKKGS
ncbi:hypothetical protein A4U88_0115 [Serratia marcescens]|nr:hypothetical protein A4U88_0115 [Serratia marcescens]